MSVLRRSSVVLMVLAWSGWRGGMKEVFGCWRTRVGSGSGEDGWLGRVKGEAGRRLFDIWAEAGQQLRRRRIVEAEAEVGWRDRKVAADAIEVTIGLAGS